jgi:GABA(A) receptor-associated protein
MYDFKSAHPLRKRLEEADKVLEKFPTMVPIIIQARQGCTLPDIDKHKYIVPGEMVMSQFMVLIRRRLKLDKNKGIFVFVGNNTLPKSSSLLCDLYKEHMESDKFLYITYTDENTFG